MQSIRLTPNVCRAILLLVMGSGFFANLIFLTHNCSFDLAGDEAQYWDWSRHLDICYYSKGPVVAYIIRASCAIFGDTMPAVRFPALLLGAGSAVIAYPLTRRLFDNERIALGAVLLSASAPLFIVGSMLMTIDAPMIFCWALATYFAAIALFDSCQHNWPWPAMGLAIGIGAMAKYGALLWLFSLLVFLLIDAQGRRLLRSPGPWIAVLVALLCLTPCVIWNARHGWVSVLHVADATGAKRSGNAIEFVAAQFGVLGPALAVILIGGVLYCARAKNDPKRREMVFLATIGLTFLGVNFLDSFIAKVQPNWPAPAYFTLIILATYFLVVRWNLRHWRILTYAAALIGIATLVVSHSESLLMRIAKPIVAAVNDVVREQLFNPALLDPMDRVRGWRTLGEVVSDERDAMGGEKVFILCDDYQQTAEASFYSRGQPATFCAGPYFGKRLSQYDMWPDRRLHDNPQLLGRDAVYVGKGNSLPAAVRAVFARCERARTIPVIVAGVQVKSFKVWRCYGFKGFGPIMAKDH